MKKPVNVVIAGLGGQGVIKASDILSEAAFRAGCVTLAQLEGIVHQMPQCEYRAYLEQEVVAEAKRLGAK